MNFEANTVFVKMKLLMFNASSIYVIDYGISNHTINIIIEIHECLELSCEQIEAKIQFQVFRNFSCLKNTGYKVAPNYISSYQYSSVDLHM